MRATILHGAYDIRSENIDDPSIIHPTDAIVRISATCVCGSDLWPYRGINKVEQPSPIGHEHCGVVEAVGNDVKNIRAGQFVIGSFFASDNTCAHCNAGMQTSCVNRELVNGCQAELLRVPQADGTLMP